MFGLVITEDAFNQNFDGIVGLAYPAFAEEGVVPFFDSLMDAGILGKKVFSFHMSMNPEEESELMLGAWDDTKFEGDLVWHNVEHKLFWSIQLDDIIIDGKSLEICGPNSGKNCLITPDSGTSMITFPSWAYKEFIAEYGGDEDCEEGNEYKYGEMIFVINGVDYTIPSHHWMERETNSNIEIGGTCTTTIGMLDVNQEGLDDLFIAGDMFMQLYYTVYDRENDKVGLAPAVHSACEMLYHWDNEGNSSTTDIVCP